jgi:hypothetical protein
MDMMVHRCRLYDARGVMTARAGFIHMNQHRPVRPMYGVKGSFDFKPSQAFFPSFLFFSFFFLVNYTDVLRIPIKLAIQASAAQ